MHPAAGKACGDPALVPPTPPGVVGVAGVGRELGRPGGGAELTGANLSMANLSNANLGAYLTGVRLFEANLTGVRPVEINLTGTNLSGADLATAKDLTQQQQLDSAQGDDETKLPASLQ